jgi:DNA-binding beta-propeller fold protein YncE
MLMLIFVVDYGDRKILKFDNNGTLLLSFGGKGEGEGQFNRPWRIDFDSDNNIYVSERGNHRIQKFDSEGNFIITWGKHGEGNGELVTCM